MHLGVSTVFKNKKYENECWRLGMLDTTKSMWALLGFCISFFIVIADVTAINVALPNIQFSLHTTISGLQWIVAGYTLTFACFLLFSGHLADLLGAKRVLLAGLCFFILTSLICALAPNIEFLIIFRILQGIAGATLVPCSLSLINTNYSDPKIRAKKIGVWASVGGIAAIVGPILGGFLTAYLSWRAVFFINIPIGIIAIVLIYLGSNENAARTERHFDVLGLALSVVSIASLSLALIEVGSSSWMSPIVVTAMIIFIVSSLLFLVVEKKMKHPMLPLHFFKIYRFSTAVSIGMVLNLGVYGQLFVLPLYFQHIRGYGIAQTGFALLPLVGLIALSSYLSGRLVSSKGIKLPLLLGLSVGAIGFFSLLTAEANTPHYFLLVFPMAAMGFGISCCQPAATIAAIHALPKERAGLAAAIFTTSRQVGSLLGVTLFGSIIATASNFIKGFHVTLIISGVLYLSAFLLALTLTSEN